MRSGLGTAHGTAAVGGATRFRAPLGMSQQLSAKPGVFPLLCTLLSWTVAFFGIPLGAFFAGRSHGLSDNAAAIAAVAAVQVVLVGFGVYAYWVNFVQETKKD